MEQTKRVLETREKEHKNNHKTLNQNLFFNFTRRTNFIKA